LATGAARNGTAFPCGSLVLLQTLRVFIASDLGGGGLAEHGEDEFEVGYVKAQVFALQALELLVLRWGDTEGGFGDFGGKDGEIFLISNATFLPFVGQFVTDGNATDALFDLVVGVALLLIEGAHPLLGQFGVFDLLHTLVADLRQPAFERFGLGAGNGLNDGEGGLGVDAIGNAILAIGCFKF